MERQVGGSTRGGLCGCGFGEVVAMKTPGLEGTFRLLFPVTSRVSGRQGRVLVWGTWSGTGSCVAVGGGIPGKQEL